MLTVVLALVLANSALGANDQNNSPTVTIPGLGTVVGETLSNNVRAFRGMRYAQPPVGQLRWKMPQKVTPWTGTYDATTFRAGCLQDNNTAQPVLNQSEDCLFLNVFAPPKDRDNKLHPVMFFVHGGSYQHGAGSLEYYNGYFNVWHSMVSGNESVVVVTINYRLQAMGFLGSTKLKTEIGSMGNFGLEDQREALMWVQENIAAFGGDKDRVYLFGESAGAGSTACHTVMERSWGLFRAVGMESGAYADWDANPLDFAEEVFEDFAEKAGCSTNPDVIDCLRKVDGRKIIEAGTATSAPSSSGIAWAPVVDGVEIMDLPWKLAQAQKVAPNITMLMGSNRDEGASFIPSTLPRNATASEVRLLLQLALKMNDSAINQTLELYPFDQYNSTPAGNNYWWAASRMVGDSLISCPTLQAANALSSARDVYLYLFMHVPFFHRGNEFVAHADELIYVFHDDPYLDTDEGGMQVANTTARYWINMARGASPNGEDTAVIWPKFTTQNQDTLFLNATASIQHNIKKAQCDFWAGFRRQDIQFPITDLPL